MKKQIHIEGMTCQNCVAHVKEALEELQAKDIVIELDGKIATATFSEDISNEIIYKSIDNAGYDVVKITDLL